MFEAAKDFVIQNGVFIDVKDGAKFYTRKLRQVYKQGSISGYRGGNNTNGTRLCNYRHIRKGDIKLVERVEDRGKPGSLDESHDDYLVEVFGENERRVARIYHGRSAHSRFETDFRTLSNLWHPRIAQVFGICKPDTFALLFHDDGIRQGFTEHALSLNPLHRAAFCLKYAEEYQDATNYLYSHFQDDFFAESAIYCSVYKYEGNHSRVVKCYVDSHRRLNIILFANTIAPTSKGNLISHAHPDSNWNVLDRKSKRLSQQVIKQIQSVFDMQNVKTLSRSKQVELISTWYTALLSVKRVKAKTEQEKTVILGKPVRIWGDSRNEYFPDHLLYVPGSFERLETILQEDYLEPNITWRQMDNLFHSDCTRLGHSTGFSLNTEAAARASLLSSHPQPRITTSTGILANSDKLFHAWLAQAPCIQQDLGLSGRFDQVNKSSKFSLGIVSDVQITVHIQIHHAPFVQFTRNYPGTKIYLFISNPGVNKTSGEIIPPHVYWTLDKMGSGLDYRYPVLKRLFTTKVSLHPKITFWNSFLYDALNELYRICDFDVSEVFHLPRFDRHRQGILKKPPSLSDDICVQSLRTEHEKNGTSSISYNSVDRKREIPSLSWIGVTALEDHLAVRGTWYGQKVHREKVLRVVTCNEEWEDIMSNADGDEMMGYTPVDEGLIESAEALEEWEDVV